MLKDVLVTLWNMLDAIMSLEIPLFEYRLTFWNIFYFSLALYFALSFFFGISSSRRGD